MQRLSKGWVANGSLYILSSLVYLAALLIPAAPSAYALVPYLGSRSVRLSDSTVSAQATYVFGFSYLNTSTAVGSVKIEFCANDPIPEDACVVPNGFDASARVLASQAGQATGFVVDPSSNVNTIIMSRVPNNPTLGNSSYIFDNITNPDTVGSYFARLQTFSSIDATGSPIEEGGTVFPITNGLSVSTEVPPYLRFCAAVTITNFDCSSATSFFIDLGEFNSGQTSKASSQFLAATNALSGYSVTINGTTLTSGNNVIPPLASPTSSSTGTSQFGINLRSNSNPNVGNDVGGPGTAGPSGNYANPNQFMYQPGDTLTTVPNSNDNRKFTVSYIANIAANQPPGFYATTLTFICLANF
ncbi:MAG TPA: hypothetical protein VLF87_02965 [Patescibacteria group bacterium]|nr:hypothetical protein [Patescibacteria group bacterium]